MVFISGTLLPSCPFNSPQRELNTQRTQALTSLLEHAVLLWHSRWHPHNTLPTAAEESKGQVQQCSRNAHRDGLNRYLNVNEV